jgi:hypothetical protein
VIDTKTGLMWLQSGRQAEKRPSLFDYIGVAGENDKGALWGNGGIHYTIAEQANHASPWDVPWGGQWRLPTIGEFEELISGWSGADPIDWLAREARFDRGYLAQADSNFWTNPSDWALATNWVYYRFFNLRTGQVVKGNLPFHLRQWTEEFVKVGSVAMYNRRLGPGEEYWWR